MLSYKSVLELVPVEMVCLCYKQLVYGWFWVDGSQELDVVGLFQLLGWCLDMFFCRFGRRLPIESRHLKNHWKKKKKRKPIHGKSL